MPGVALGQDHNLHRWHQASVWQWREAGLMQAYLPLLDHLLVQMPHTHQQL